MQDDQQKMSEDRIQSEFHKWLWNYYPLTRGLCFAIENGGYRTKQEGNKLKAKGVVSGIPDYHIAIPAARPDNPASFLNAGTYHGMYIEFKEPGKNTEIRRAAGRKLSEHEINQLAAQERLRVAGYKVIICDDLQAAKDAVISYLYGSGYLNQVQRISGAINKDNYL